MTDPLELDRPIICPYDSNHSIATSRIQKHLVKCARNFLPDYKVTCPYNATHRLFKNEIREHITKCPDHQYVDPIIYEIHNKRGAAMSSITSESQSVIDCQESWDEEEGNSYPISHASDCQPATSLDAVRRSSFRQRASIFVPPKIPLQLGVCNRAPSGLAEALMIDDSGESTIDDIESVASFMGMGRGKPCAQLRNEIVTKIGKDGELNNSKSRLDRYENY